MCVCVADEACLAPTTVKSTLTLMFSCGMYDYSGEWCVHVGLPAKSGVAGLVYVVVPHVSVALGGTLLTCVDLGYTNRAVYELDEVANGFFFRGYQ